FEPDWFANADPDRSRFGKALFLLFEAEEPVNAHGNYWQIKSRCKQADAFAEFGHLARLRPLAFRKNQYVVALVSAASGIWNASRVPRLRGTQKHMEERRSQKVAKRGAPAPQKNPFARRIALSAHHPPRHRGSEPMTQLRRQCFENKANIKIGDVVRDHQRR